MNLYLIQDADRQMYVASESFEKALGRWRENIVLENPSVSLSDDDGPEGISFVAGKNELIFPGTKFPVIDP